MPDFLDVGASIIGRVEQTTQVAANNISNLNTPGYLARSLKSDFYTNLSTPKGNVELPLQGAIDLTNNAVYPTHSPLDAAVQGPAFIPLNVPSGVAYAKCVQIRVGSDGVLRSPDGYSLQSVHGGEITVKTQSPQILFDGGVMENGELVGQIALVDFTNASEVSSGPGGLVTTPSANTKTASKSQILAGYLAGSNVETAHEMVTLMAAIRDAQTGQRLVQTYDDLMGRAISNFS